MYVYETVSEAINELKKRGYTMDFNLEENSFISREGPVKPEDLEIVEIYRFEGNTDPADEAVVYAIESKKGGKGILINGYGASAAEPGSELAKKLHINIS